MKTVSSLKVIFAGTPAFAAVALQALLHSQHQVIAVYTQPDKPAGRGLQLTASPVKQLALSHQLAVYQPASLKSMEEQTFLAHLKADVMVVAAYGLILPKAVLEIPRLGCINIHPSLLPRWRGAAPIQRTIFAGDAQTGVSIMQMDEGLDTGPVLLQRLYTLMPNETSATLHDKLALMGADALVQTLDLMASDKVQAQVQAINGVTYAAKMTKEEAKIDWSLPAKILEQQIRAFNPWPVAHTTWQAQALRIWMAEALSLSHDQSPGTVLGVTAEGIDIATGLGVLRLLSLQLPGGKALPVADFYNAKRSQLLVGEQLK
jgi:methionyl-tRNA formyltransferase